MKKTTYVVALGIFALTTLAGCFEIEDAAPSFDAANVKTAVQGRWSIEKITNKLCRDNSCSSTQQGGSSAEYFEFRADSVFITRRSTVNNGTVQDAYKASFNEGGVILLSNYNRMERFEVQDIRSKKLVLQSTFTGRDPAAVFTDTYYLYR